MSHILKFGDASKSPAGDTVSPVRDVFASSNCGICDTAGCLACTSKILCSNLGVTINIEWPWTSHYRLFVSDHSNELLIRPAFFLELELQLVMVVGKISGFRNCLRIASYTRDETGNGKRPVRSGTGREFLTGRYTGTG